MQEKIHHTEDLSLESSIFCVGLLKPDEQEQGPLPFAGKLQLDRIYNCLIFGWITPLLKEEIT